MAHYRWAEGWLAGYWVLTSVLLIFGPKANQATIELGLLQAVAAVVLFVFNGWCQRHSGLTWMSWLVWIPAILWTYKNIDVVQKALNRPSFESQVQAWEKAIWKFSPALEWSQAWPWLVFSEALHFCYCTYYLILPVLLVRLLRRDRDDLARICLAGGVSALVCSYFGSIWFPVQGPRPLFPPLAAELQGPLWTFCHWLSREGAAAAAAFPSGHVSLSSCVAIMAWRWDRKWMPLYLPWALGIAAATVYGRFHYTVDAAAGLMVAIFCAGVVLARDPDS